MLNNPTCQFCKTDSTHNPCKLPEGAHQKGIEIHSGPDKDGNYSYTIFWFNKGRHRQRAQAFKAPLPKDNWWLK